MAGVPLLLGFVAKESAYAAFTDGPFSASAVVLAGIVAGSTLTVAYSLRFVWGAFVLAGAADTAMPRRRQRRARRRAPAGSSPRPPCSALLSVVTGVVPALLDRLVTAATQRPRPRQPEPPTSRCGTGSTRRSSSPS